MLPARTRIVTTAVMQVACGALVLSCSSPRSSPSRAGATTVNQACAHAPGPTHEGAGAARANDAAAPGSRAPSAPMHSCTGAGLRRRTPTRRVVDMPNVPSGSREFVVCHQSHS
ncbi:jg4208 [Pararge aegeria aegeria]|uniref:Jg4208 protein n=1 Tax=Pararge aegeria aegeria TaxID=348720 RepID=A0A8S4R5S9_9NEOP|nr:jg4208 [Pararge aegeria aegeria]